MTLRDALKKSPFGYAKKTYNGTELFHTEGLQFVNQGGHLIPTNKNVELGATDWEPVISDGH